MIPGQHEYIHHTIDLDSHPIEHKYHQGFYEIIEVVPIESQDDGTSLIGEKTYTKKDYPPIEDLYEGKSLGVREKTIG